MKIQSYSDVITNSSSEIFMFKSDLPYDFLKDLIKEHADNHMYDYDKNGYDKIANMTIEERDMYNFYSGMGGFLEINTIDSYNKKWGENNDPEKYNFVVDIDHSFNATIKYIEDNFENVVCEC